MGSFGTIYLFKSSYINTSMFIFIIINIIITIIIIIIIIIPSIINHCINNMFMQEDQGVTLMHTLTK